MSPDTVTVPRSGAPVSGSDVPATSSAPVSVTTSDVSPPAHHKTTAAPDTSTTTVVSSATVIPVPHHTVSEMSVSKVKLPKLEPKKFTGDLTKWESFWSLFESAIHVNPTLSKFQYLISLLDGPAFAAVAGLKLTEPNYNEAI